MKYRVGNKQHRAVLDENGIEVVVFPKGKEMYATQFCLFLNKSENKFLAEKAKILKKAKENARFESGTDKVGFIYISQLEELLA